MLLKRLLLTKSLLSEKVETYSFGINNNTKDNTMPTKTLFGLFLLLIQLCLSVSFASEQTSNPTKTESNDIVFEHHLDNPPVLLNVDSYGVKDGLSQSTITSVTEDDDGYIWLGTMNGLNRFDGQHFENFFANDGTGLDSSLIKSVFYSKNLKKLLVSTEHSLYEYLREKESFKKIRENTDIYLIEEQKDKLIFIDKYKIITNFDFEKPIKINIDNIRKSIIFGDSTINLTHSGDLYFDSSIIDLNVKDIILKNNKIYILNDNEFYSIDMFKNKKNILKNANYDSIFLMKNKLFLTKNGDLFFMKDGIINFFGKVKNKDFSIKSHHIIKDFRYSTFLSNQNGDFFIFKDTRNIIKNTSITKNSVWSISYYDKDNVIISDESNKIKIYNNTLEKYKEIDCKISGYKSTLSIPNGLIISSLSGTYFCRKDKPLKKIINSASTIARKIDNYYFIGSTDGLLYILNNDLTLKTKLEVEKSKPIFDIMKYRKKIYIASQSGLFLFKNERLKKIIKNEIIYSMSYEGDKLILGTNDGIIDFNIKSNSIDSRKYRNKPIFTIRSLNGITAATSVGEVIISNKKNKYFIGLPLGSQSEYNTQSLSYLNSDKIILGGVSGVSILDLNLVLDKNFNNISTNISKLKVFNIPVKPGTPKLKESTLTQSEITLKQSDYPFSLDFNSPNSIFPNIDYKYRLLGLSSEWIMSRGSNFATYTNLSPGEYFFEVFGINPLTSMPGKKTRIRIFILPPWWWSSIAKFIYGIFFISTLLLLFKLYLRRRETQRLIAQSEERLKLSLWQGGIVLL